MSRCDLPPVILLFLAIQLSFIACDSSETGSDSAAETNSYDLERPFVRGDATAESSTGQTVIADCLPEGETWADASATIHVVQGAESTRVEMELFDARPNSLFSAWVRLKGKDPVTGETWGNNPITGKGSTPLAPSGELAALVEVSDEEGASDAINSFRTDEEGHGALTVELDFQLIDGAYPFDRYDASLAPAPTVRPPYSAYLVRIASHCTDDLIHGLDPGNHEIWFNWSL
jgi:hypothetical protein